jgi:hypothetical protein
MLKKELKLIVTFYTTSAAMATEKVCKENDIEGSLISAPRELSADCGISFATDVKNRDKIVKLLLDKHIEYESVVEIKV